MKKTYISPAMLTVQLGTVRMMAESLAINRSGVTIENSEDILVKENTASDVNPWNNEW